MMKDIDFVKQISKYGRILFDSDHEEEYRAFEKWEKKNQKNETYRIQDTEYATESSPMILSKSEMIPNSVKYNHLLNERDWYSKRMESYRESFWKVVNLIKEYKSQIPDNLYKEILKEYDKY